MAVKFWWPSAMPDQVVLMQNFSVKIANYVTVLGLTPAQQDAGEALCSGFISAFNAAEQCKATMIAMTRWRDEVFYGEPAGGTAQPAPVFPVVSLNEYTVGTVTEFFRLRDRIVASAGYTQAIGEDLGIVGATIIPPAPDTVTPDLKASTTGNYRVQISGSMQGADALRVEYAPSGGNFAPIAFLTNTPGTFQITPAEPNQPETGTIRAVYIKKNVEYGNYSANYPVTVS